MSAGPLRTKKVTAHQLATIGRVQPDEPGLISIAQAAKRLGISTRTAYEWANIDGAMPGLVVVNNRRYVRRLVLERYLAGE